MRTLTSRKRMRTLTTQKNNKMKPKEIKMFNLGTVTIMMEIVTMTKMMMKLMNTVIAKCIMMIII